MYNYFGKIPVLFSCLRLFFLAMLLSKRLMTKALGAYVFTSWYQACVELENSFQCKNDHESFFPGLLTVTLDADDGESGYFFSNFPTDADAYLIKETDSIDQQALTKPGGPTPVDPADIVFQHNYATPGCRNVTLIVSNYISSIKETKEVGEVLH